MYNQFFICQTYRPEPIPWDLQDPTVKEAPEYFRRVLQNVDAALGPQGLTFYLTWKLDELPRTGDDVVAVVLGDEWSRLPAYRHDVLALFKCYGTRPSPGFRPGLPPSRLDVLLSLKFARTSFFYLPGLARNVARSLRRRMDGRSRPPVVPIPLGYGNQMELPVRPILERSTDLFFAGSVEHGQYSPLSPQYWMESPKEVSRAQMLDAVDTIQRTQPDVTARLSVTSTFALNALHWNHNTEGILDAETYSAHMMDTKICLVPRGTSPETYRYFEAMRYGCVLVTERLPSHWFYEGSPAIQLDDWRDLSATVDRLLSDPDLLRRKHDEALDWWATRCAPDALAARMIDTLRSVRPQPAAAVPAAAASPAS
jgi:hypothetical protein